jgi:hypothetical protein
MNHGRLVKITFADGRHAVFVVAEEDAERAVSLIKVTAPSDAMLESVGRVSLNLLKVLNLQPGAFTRA